jgi:hypothetical protein
MYFADLSPYIFLKQRPLAGVLNVGWLASGHPIPTGDVPPGFVDNLLTCIVAFRANQMRGFHFCEFCPSTSSLSPPMLSMRLKSKKKIFLGSAEVWLPAPEGKVFAAPDLVAHYVAAHQYCPPADFIAAVEAAPSLVGWDAEKELEERILAARKDLT